MRNLFTRFLMIVFLLGIMAQAYSAGLVSPPALPDVAVQWPEDESETQAQPGSGNVFVLEFDKDLNATQPFGPDGVIALSREDALGYTQVEAILYKVDGAAKVTKVGSNKVEIRFDYAVEEDSTYHITIEDDAIRFADGTWFSGITYHDWRFTVDDVTPPVMAECSNPDNVNGQWGVSVDQNPIVICFDELVQWAPGVDPYEIGNIAFYTASKAGLSPFDEFGGDVIYEAPYMVVPYANGVPIFAAQGEKSASIAVDPDPVPSTPLMFDQLVVFPKEKTQPYNPSLKHAAIGNHVWPEDRDIYLRFAAGMLVDKAGNPFAGISGSPTDPYSNPGDQYWFSTREEGGITPTIMAVKDGTATSTTEPLWASDDIYVRVNSTDLEFTDGTPITSSNVADFIKLSNDGNEIAYTLDGSGVSGAYTWFRLEPGSLAPYEEDTIDVEIVGGVVQDNSDLRVVESATEDFLVGDFSAPVFDPITINNELCTNFDIRVKSDEVGTVYYAIVKEPVPAHWTDASVSAADILSGVNTVTVGGTTYTYYFNHVDDGDYGQNVTTYAANSFNINETLVSFEHVDDFTEENNGDSYRVYYFSFDEDAQASNSLSLNGGVGVASSVGVLPVQLSDCLTPDLTWLYEHENAQLGDVDCEVDGTIAKNGVWTLDFTSNDLVEALKLVDAGSSWEDVIRLDVKPVSEDWINGVEIASIDEIKDGDDVIGLEVTPLNAYPSGGRARVTIWSGSIEDLAGNAVNKLIRCNKPVEVYADPMVSGFTVEVKSLMSNHENYAGLGGVAAQADGDITISFNNPMFIPKRDENNSPYLEELSDNPADENYVGQYIKLREGDLNDANVTDDVVSDSEIPLSFTLTKTNGGVTKIVITPGADYKSETWYYVELESELQDVNRVDLGTLDNNNFVDPHGLSTPNTANYFMKFRVEDTVSPELRFYFSKYTNDNPADYDDPDNWEVYIEESDSALVECTNREGIVYPWGASTAYPIGALITEWSKMGFDNKDYYVQEDPNGLRPYFTLKHGEEELDFDIVVVRIFEPNDNPPFPYASDAVWFRFVPFEELEEGQTYTMEFNPNYQAPLEGQPEELAEGPVFVDDNNNPLMKNTLVEFTTCTPNTEDCFEGELAVEGGTLEPTVTVNFDRNFDPIEGFIIDPAYFTLTDGTDTWRCNDAGDFVYNNNELTVSFSSFEKEVLDSFWIPPFLGIPGSWQYFTSWDYTPLDENTTYTITLNEDTFDDRNGIFSNCESSITFTTPDFTAPRVDMLSPDIDVDNGNAENANPYSIDPRNPGKLTISWDEPVVLQDNKEVQVWQNGTTVRVTYTKADFVYDAGTYSASVDLPVDFLQYNSPFHVDVEEGFVKDEAGNENEHLTGNTDGTDTWTFRTAEEPVAPELVSWTPSCIVEPGNMFTSIYNGDSVQVNAITLTLDQGVLPVSGKLLILKQFGAANPDLLAIDVADMVASNDDRTYTYTPTQPLVLASNKSYRMRMQEGAFVNNYPTNSTLVTPDYTGEDFLACGSENYSFRFEDTTVPTVEIWPENDDNYVPFNAHGYIRFSESLLAVKGNQTLVLTQSNIKKWVKVYKADADGDGNPTASFSMMNDYDYVCEFVNPGRTHIRVTFLDEEAPAIEGVTANMKDEWQYRIVVQQVDNDGYILEDQAGNAISETSSTFTTEDITPPVLVVRTCDVKAQSIQIFFDSYENNSPYGMNRVYPAEAGTVYWTVLPADAPAPTAAQLYNGLVPNVETKFINTTGSVTWSPSEIDLETTGYNYKVYAVMQDDETDVYVAESFGNAWPTTDAVFVKAGDTDPAFGAIGLADIRPAENKSMARKGWEFCFCDDDAPQFASKGWDKDLNVPVGESFEITFDEMVQFGQGVQTDGQGTGGYPFNEDRSYEVRLREWNNNVAVPITIALNAEGDGFIITPDDNLEEETRYYIEIDRNVIWDVAGSNCEKYENDDVPEGVSELECSACSTDDYQNNFSGWTGRYDWWFQTTDNTAPQLVDVAPVSECTSVDNNQIVFTFKEKNEMVINNLGNAQDNSIYVYKDGATVPYEIISAHSTTPVRTGVDSWTITYTTTHPYNSLESYYILWNKDLFTDNAVPTAHNYEIVSGDVIDNYDGDTDWNQFGFTAEDSDYPVAHWAFLNTTWNDSLLVMTDSLNPNDPLSTPVDICDIASLPQEAIFVVWFNEEVTTTRPAGYSDNQWINYNFMLETEAGSDVPLAYVSHGTGPATVGHVDVPAGKQYFVMEPANTLASSTNFEFGIIGNRISDVAEGSCRENLLEDELLFNFCTWNAEPAVATLFDGTENEIIDTDERVTCIAEREYVRLVFDKKMAKTSQVANYFDPMGFLTGENYNNLWLGYPNAMVDFRNDGNGEIIKFYEEGGDYVEIDHVDVVEEGKEFILWLKEPMTSEGNYTFEILPEALKDIVRVPLGNDYPGNTWIFKVNDWEAPYIVDQTPFDGAENVNPVEPLEFVFNEDVTLGTARIIIRSNDSVFYNFAANDVQHVSLGVDDRTVTINHEGLRADTEYFVEIQPEFAFDEDCKYLPFEGSDEQELFEEEWNFTTGDVDGPVASLWPVPGDECVELDANLVMRFDENIELTNAGRAVIYKVREGETWHGTNFADVVEVIDLTTANYPQVKITGSDVANGRDADIVTITPSEGLWESDGTYYVRIVGNGVTEDTEADVILDAAKNSWMYPVPANHGFTLLPGIHHNQWYFTIGNNDEPELIGFTPDRGDEVEAGVASATTDLTMTFADQVAFGNGMIQVWEFIENPEGGVAEQQAQLWKEFDVATAVADGKITLSADMTKVTIHDVELMDGINWYYVIVESGVITNNIECTNRAWSGISNPDQWLFTTAPDVTLPELSGNPMITSDACSETYLEPATVMFELTFSEPVSVVNGTGVVEIQEEGGSVVATATITSDMIEDNVVTLSIDDFTGEIADQTAYELVIGTDAIHDRATASMSVALDPFGMVPTGNGNFYEGTVIPFETGDFTAPTARVFVPTAVDLENDVTLVVTFDEGVMDGEGMLNLYDAATDALVASFDAASDEDNDPASLTFSTTLPDETSYYVMIEEGFVTDSVYMGSCDFVRNNNALDTVSWTFAIDDNTAPYITEDLTEDTDNLMMTFDIVLQYDDTITVVDASKATFHMDSSVVVGTVNSAVIGTDATQVIVNVTAPQDQSDYVLELADAFVMDNAINPNASLADTTGIYHVGDRTKPVLEAYMPTSILPSYIEVAVIADFFDDSELTVVEPFVITDGAGDTVTTWTPDFANAEQIDSILPSLWFDTYTVIIPAGSVVDANGNEFDGATWNFMIEDNIEPNCMTIVSPVDGASAVAADVDLVMDFCERVAPGDAAKMLKVYSVLEVQGGLDVNQLFMETPVTADMISGVTVTVPLTGLADATSYIVMIDYDAIRDEAGNSYEGINDPVTWNFTTADNTAPTVVLTPDTILDAENTIVLTAEFSEEVVGAETDIMVEGATSYTVEMNTTNDVATITIEAADLDTVMVTIPTTITDVPDGKGYGNELAEAATGFYVVADNTAPAIVTHSPEGDLENAHPESIVIEFTEDVTLGSGSITVYNEDGTVALDVPAGSVTVEGNVVSFDLAGSFDKFATYYVLVSSGFVSDAAGNVYEGLSDVTDWVFNTGDFATAIDPDIDAVQYKVYPNPFNNFIRIDNSDKLDRIVISNIAGQRVLDIENPTHEIRTGNLVTGVYVVTLISNDEIVKSERIIKR